MSTERGTEGLVFYVATDGDDGWSGKISVPNEKKTDGHLGPTKQQVKRVSTMYGTIPHQGLQQAI